MKAGRGISLMRKRAEAMKSLEAAMSETDFAILKNSINIDKYPKMFMAQTKMIFSCIIDGYGFILK